MTVDWFYADGPGAVPVEFGAMWAAQDRAQVALDAALNCKGTAQEFAALENDAFLWGVEALRLERVAREAFASYLDRSV